jgi:hypothetical protein
MSEEPTRLTWRFGAVAVAVEVTREGGIWCFLARGQRNRLEAHGKDFNDTAKRLELRIQAAIDERRARAAPA